MHPALMSLIVGLTTISATHQAETRTDAFGDPLPTNAVARIGTIRLRHGNQVGSVAFTPDGTRVVSTDWYSVGIWEFATGRCVAFRLLAPQMGCWAAVSADGSLIACRLQDESLGVQETETGKQRASFPNSKAEVHNLAFSSDNRWLTSTETNRDVSVWDVASGTLRHRWSSPEKSRESRSSFTPDGRFLVHATHLGHLLLWNVQTGEEVWRVAPTRKESEYYLGGLDVSADGQTVAVMHQWRRMELWDVQNGKLRREFECHGSWHGPVFSPDGKTLACGTMRGQVLFWNAATGKLDRKLPVDVRGVPTSLAFSSDCKRFAVGCDDHAVRLWNLADDRELFPVGDLDGKISARFLADRKTLVTTSNYWSQIQSGSLDGRLGFWDLTGKSVKRTSFDSKEAYVFALSPDGRTLILGEGYSMMRYHRPVPNGGLHSVLHLQDLANGKKLQKIEMDNDVHEVAFSSDGRFVFTSVDNPGENPEHYHRVSVVQAWKRTASNTLVKLWEHPSIGAWSERFAVAPDCRWIAISTEVGPDIRDCETGKLLCHLPDGMGAVRAASPSGRMLLRCKDSERTATLIELASGGTICKLDCDPRYLVRPCFAFSTDGRIVATDLNSEQIHLFDAFTGKRIGKLEGHRGHIHSLCFSPDDRCVVSGSEDGTVLIWDHHKALAQEPVASPLSAERIEQLWLDLRSTDAGHGYRAIGMLIRCPEEAITLLRRKVSPTTAEDHRKMEKRIDELDDMDFAIRQRASVELAEFGALAEPILRRALTKAMPLETERRVGMLLAKASGPRWLAAVRGVEILERIGSTESRALLEELCGGVPESPLTLETRRSLDRMR
jgi:WD40 repeat protein